jgi:pheromone shutdown protein TraB
VEKEIVAVRVADHHQGVTIILKNHSPRHPKEGLMERLSLV